jgi:hypothetical protein
VVEADTQRAESSHLAIPVTFRIILAGVKTMRSRLPVAFILWIATSLPLLWGQAADPPLAFEVASIKLHAPPSGTIYLVVRRNPPDLPGESRRRFSDHSTTIETLIERAYDVKPSQVFGLPEWARDGRAGGEYYDLDAIAAMENPSREQMQTMLKSLLAERCQLKLRRETRELPVYALTIASGGIKFKPLVDDVKPTSMTLYMFVYTISRYVDRPIVDHTGLNGYFTFASIPREYLADLNDDPGASLSPLLKEYHGLELKPTVERTEVLVVDHVERPSAN